MKKTILNHIQRLSKNNKVHLFLLAVSILFIILTSIFVAYKSSIIHSYNHDNLIDSYMFNSYADFKAASFPASHTFLIKWPLFALSGLLGNTHETFAILAVSLYLITVLSVVALIIYICKKRIILGALCITVYGLILLMTPAQSAPGILAPVNMAMITTRNIEYIVYILFLFLISKSTKLLSWSGLLAIVTIILLGISDKLFLLMGLAGAIFNVIYQITFIKGQDKESVARSIYPLIYIIIGYALITGLSVLINVLHITSIFEPLTSAPFNFVASVSQAITAFEWAVQATLVNFGINPFGGSIGVKILPHVINFSILLVAIYASIKLYLTNPKEKTSHTPVVYDLGYWLFLSTLAALAIYTFSNHYLENDLRYMSIATFSGILSIAIYFSKKEILKISNSAILITTVALLILSPLYVLTARSGFNRDLNATKSIFEPKLTIIAEATKQYDVKVFIAEYWYTSPVRYRMNNTIQTSPLMGTPCISKNYFLTSSNWYQPRNINDHSALYIIKGKSVESDKCLEEIQQSLGSPVKVVPLNDQKTDELWIYNYDIRSKLKW